MEFQQVLPVDYIDTLAHGTVTNYKDDLVFMNNS